MTQKHTPILEGGFASVSPGALRPAAAGMPLALLLMSLSGLAGLGWQIVWTAQLGTVLGHEMVAVLAVLAAFFGGLAVGAHALGRRIARSRFPARWYVGCEVVIALWGGLLVTVTPALMGAWAGLAGAEPALAWHWALAFAGPFLLLLPATAAMGATLPAIERVLASREVSASSTSLGGLYAANTAGAVAGALLAAFVLMPIFGLMRSGWCCAALNLACALGALAWWQHAVPALPPMVSAPRTAKPKRLLVTLAVTGLLGIAYEVFAVRLLSQVNENTVYSYALALAVYLLGTAMGAAIYQRWLARHADAASLQSRLLTALALGIALGGWALGWADVLVAWPARSFGPSVATALIGEALAALFAMLPPTLVMGALFSHLCRDALSKGMPLGSAVAVNTVGAALAAPITAMALPLLGARIGIAALALSYLLLQLPPRVPRPAVWAVASVALALIFAPRLGWGGGDPAFVDVPPGGRVLSHREGVMATVSVVEDGDGVARLRINNRQQEGSSASGLADARLAYLPLLWHPSPSRALFLGLGTGVTAAAAAEDSQLQVDVVELLPEVARAAAEFPRGAQSPNPVHTPHVIQADARRYVRASDARYDVIVADLFHPARSGSGALYTVEHFTAVRERLAAGGVFCQWLALHQMDLATVRSITAAFLQVFPEANAVLAGNSLSTPVLGLIARPQSPRSNVTAIRSRLAEPRNAARLAQLGFTDEFALLGNVIAGPSALAHFAADAAPNTDDHPRVAHRAPFATYAPEAAPGERLLALLAALHPLADEIIDTASGDAAFPQRLSAYWSARDLYLQTGLGIRPDPDVRVMLDRVQAPLLAVLRLSADFRPAYDPLLAMALAVAPTDPERARELLTELVTQVPARTEATQALQNLPSPSSP